MVLLSHVVSIQITQGCFFFNNLHKIIKQITYLLGKLAIKTLVRPHVTKVAIYFSMAVIVHTINLTTRLYKKCLRAKKTFQRANL